MAIKPEPQEGVLPPPPQTKTNSKPAPDPAKVEKERQGAIKALTEHRRAIAWPVARWPLERRVVHARTRVHLPRTYLARHGSDVRTVWAGADINQVVHRYYREEVARGGERKEKDARRTEKGNAVDERTKKTEGEAWPNYVAEGILSQRHEYLGPDPRVAGYSVDADGEYHVKFYDTFLKDQWMDSRKWSFDVRWDDETGKWVDVDE